MEAYENAGLIHLVSAGAGGLQRKLERSNEACLVCASSNDEREIHGQRLQAEHQLRLELRRIHIRVQLHAHFIHCCI